jgi:hypothetical protein
MPPALVVRASSIRSRDEGAAWRERPGRGGVQARHLPRCRGQIHTSLMAVDAILSGAGARAKWALFLRQFFGAPVPA